MIQEPDMLFQKDIHQKNVIAAKSWAHTVLLRKTYNICAGALYILAARKVEHRTITNAGRPSCGKGFQARVETNTLHPVYMMIAK